LRATSRLTADGKLVSGDAPTKEVPLHSALYQSRGAARAPVLIETPWSMPAQLVLVHAPALGRAASSIYAVLEATQAMGERELQLVAAQDRLVSPPRRFVPERL